MYVIAFALAANVNPEHATSSPATDPEHDERQVERRRPARERDRVRDPRDDRELRLERVDLGAERGDPVRVERLGDQLALASGEVGRGEEDPGHGLG